ncbi:MAG: hypothetical protein IJL30_03465 [Clostridia bacterium]|nr:hypothetical protein [Clostridia bacterium]
MKRIATIAVVCLFVIAIITGCTGEGSSSSAAAGRYVIKTINGQSVEEALDASADLINELFGISSPEEFMVFVLNADGTAVINIADEEPSEGTWKQNGNTLLITVEGETVECPLNGNEFTFSIEDEEYVLIKK